MERFAGNYDSDGSFEDEDDENYKDTNYSAKGKQKSKKRNPNQWLSSHRSRFQSTLLQVRGVFALRPAASF